MNLSLAPGALTCEKPRISDGASRGREVAHRRSSRDPKVCESLASPLTDSQPKFERTERGHNSVAGLSFSVGAPRSSDGNGPDRGLADYFFCKVAAQRGWSMEATEQRLLEVSEKARERARCGDEGYAHVTCSECSRRGGRRTQAGQGVAGTGVTNGTLVVLELSIHNKDNRLLNLLWPPSERFHTWRCM